MFAIVVIVDVLESWSPSVPASRCPRVPVSRRPGVLVSRWFCCNSVWAAAVPITRLVVACCKLLLQLRVAVAVAWSGLVWSWQLYNCKTIRVDAAERGADIIESCVAAPGCCLFLLQHGDASDMTSAHNFRGRLAAGGWRRGAFPGTCVRIRHVLCVSCVLPKYIYAQH